MEEKNNVQNKEESKGFGVASLWCGIIGLALFIAPYIGIFLSIIAIIFSYQQYKIFNTNSATAGKVLGIIGVIVNIIVLLIIGIAVVGFSGDSNTQESLGDEENGINNNQNSQAQESIEREENSQESTEDEQESQTSQEESSNEPELYFAGERVEVGDFAYTINSYSTTNEIGEYSYDTFIGEKADGIFLVLDVTIENIAKESKTIWGSNIKVVDDQGRTFEHDTTAEIYLDESFSFEQMQPGLPKTGKVVFDIPENVNGKLEISANSMWSDEVKYVSWNEKE